MCKGVDSGRREREVIFSVETRINDENFAVLDFIGFFSRIDYDTFGSQIESPKATKSSIDMM